MKSFRFAKVRCFIVKILLKSFSDQFTAKAELDDVNLLYHNSTYKALLDWEPIWEKFVSKSGAPKFCVKSVLLTSITVNGCR